jgi:hypothetical protein
MPQALHFYSTPPPTGWYARQANNYAVPASGDDRHPPSFSLLSHTHTYLFVLQGTAHDTRTGSSRLFSSSIAAIPLTIRVERLGGTIYNPPFDSPTLSSSKKKKEHYQNSSTSLTLKLARINSYLKEASFIDYRNEWR